MKVRSFIFSLIPPIYFDLKKWIKPSPYKIGMGTYGNPKIIGHGVLEIGNYCSIADNVTIILYGHHTCDFSTYPFDFREHNEAKTGKVIIGNDVWIGYGAIIVANAIIGDGAVIGAGSVVRGKIKPYSIVAGNPAEFISMRFDKDKIDKLSNSKWWIFSKQQINAIMRYLTLITLIFLSLTGMGQDLKQSYKQYIEYCNETVTDTIEEYGELYATKEVPIYGSCGDIVGYRETATGDTTWKGYKCKEWLSIGHGWIYAGQGIQVDSVLTWEGWTGKYRITNVSCKVSRKHICTVKREKPSSEGFYQWLYKQIAK